MATIEAPVFQSLSEKLASIEVDVAEVEPESPQMELNRLTMQSPVLHPKPVTVVRCPPEGPIPGHLRPSSPTGSVRSSFSSSRRRVTRHTHYNGRFSHSHRSEVSKELSMEAEREFLALVELMSGISRRSSSLKDVWTKIISERESFALEMDRVYEQLEESTETVEQYQRERHSHGHEHEERKKEVARLHIEITAAAALSAELKKKLTDRDHELGKTRSELSELKDVYKYVKEEHEETKKTLEETQLKLVVTEESCREAQQDAKDARCELETLDLKYVELRDNHTELTTKFESTRKETTTLRQTVASYKKEQHEWLHSKSEYEERLRRCHHHEEELKRKVHELTETFEKKKHELSHTIEKQERQLVETKETLSKVRHETEELHEKVNRLRIELDEKHHHWDDAEARCGKWKLKWEDCHREFTSVSEEYRLLEIERTELEETLVTKTEEHRCLVIEKKQLENDYHEKCKECKNLHREMIAVKETLRRVETTLKEKTELVHSLHERIERIERDRDDAQGRCGDAEAQLTVLQATVVSLKVDIESITSERDSCRERFHECETRYEEVCEQMTEYQEGNSGYEFELSSMRTWLHEAREERERAITMRIAADKERDQAISRFEAKCREMDKLELRLTEAASSHSHGHSHGGKFVSGGRSVSRRVFSASGGSVAESEVE